MELDWDHEVKRKLKYYDIAKNFICIKYGLEKLYRPISSYLVIETSEIMCIKIEAALKENSNEIRHFTIDINKKTKECKELTGD